MIRKHDFAIGGGQSAIAPKRWYDGPNTWGPKGRAIMVGKWYRAYCSRHGNRAGVKNATIRINLEARK